MDRRGFLVAMPVLAMPVLVMTGCARPRAGSVAVPVTGMTARFLAAAHE